MIDLDKLMEAAKSESTGDSEIDYHQVRSKYHKNVLTFIRKRNIKSGNVRIPVYRLIYAYYHEDKLKSKFKASNVEFGRVLSLYFDKCRSGKYRYYMLNSFCDMSKETMEKAKKYYKSYHLKKGRRCQKKKVEEVEQSTETLTQI
jgi:hypothetical protein